MLARVQVEHESDQGALQAGAGAAQHVEARAGELDAALEVDDAERLAELPVRSRRETELASRARGPHHDVLRLVRSDRYVRFGQVRHFEEQRVQLRLDAA